MKRALLQTKVDNPVFGLRHETACEVKIDASPMPPQLVSRGQRVFLLERQDRDALYYAEVFVRSLDEPEPEGPAIFDDEHACKGCGDVISAFCSNCASDHYETR